MNAFRLNLLAVALACGVAAFLAPAVAANADANAPTVMPAALRPALYQALAKDAGPVYRVGKDGCAALPRQKLTACFDARGAHFTGGAKPLSLHLVAWGRSGDLASVALVQPQIEDTQVSYTHGGLTEWWRVLPLGFEQGFTIAKRPAGHGELTLALAMSRQDAGAPTLRHSRAGGNPVGTSPSIPLRFEGGKGIVSDDSGMTRKGDELAFGRLRYGKLVVTDAKGKVVPATLRSEGEHILIAVNDAHAVYPLTVDPLVWLEQKVVASDGAESDFFGSSIALDGATAIVGAAAADVAGKVNQGAVYVFSKSDGVWSQTQKLAASDGAESDFFGSSVALDGATAIVGADGADVNANDDQGAAYVFSKSDGVWSQTQKLAASDGAESDFFGSSVALDGATAIVGADGADVNANDDQGAAYVFSESGGTWTQTQKLTATDGASEDGFGLSVALDGGTAFLGALRAEVNGNIFQGAAYVFIDSGGSWAQAQKLTASDGASFAFFGKSVAFNGTTAIVGADGADVNGNSSQGAAYVFAESGGNWSETQKLIAGDGAAGDEFGGSVALDGTTALIGATQPLFSDPRIDAAYVFAESGGNWNEAQKLTASDGAANDDFGVVALDGANALVGAPGADINSNSFQGAAYFYQADADLSLVTAAPVQVYRYDDYVAQTFATNNASVTAAAVIVTVAVPAAASFVSATSTQGDCAENAGTVTCHFGSIGSGGVAYASVTLKATGDGGTTIGNTASIVNATPKLSDAAPTHIYTCSADFAEYDGTLAPGASALTPPYQAAAGKQTIAFIAPLDFTLAVGYRKDDQSPWTIRRVRPHALFHYGPAGTYRWGIQAGPGGGAFTLCILHP